MAEIDDAAVGGVQRGLTKGASGEASERLRTGHGHERMLGDGRRRRWCGLAVQGGEANEGGLEGLRLNVQLQRRPCEQALRVHQAGLKVETLGVGERSWVQARCAE